MVNKNNKTKRYVITESKNSGKMRRFHVVDTQTGNIAKGQLEKTEALEIEGKLNGKPHKKKE